MTLLKTNLVITLQKNQNDVLIFCMKNFCPLKELALMNFHTPLWIRHYRIYAPKVAFQYGGTTMYRNKMTTVCIHH
jgi:hypothetical protein